MVFPALKPKDIEPVQKSPMANYHLSITTNDFAVC